MAYTLYLDNEPRVVEIAEVDLNELQSRQPLFQEKDLTGKCQGSRTT